MKPVLNEFFFLLQQFIQNNDHKQTISSIHIGKIHSMTYELETKFMNPYFFSYQTSQVTMAL